jgi:hypothetical protein
MAPRPPHARRAPAKPWHASIPQAPNAQALAITTTRPPPLGRGRLDLATREDGGLGRGYRMIETTE